MPLSTTAAPSSSGGLDPQIVNLAQAIRQQESGGSPTKVGASGEYGAYQWEPSTWTTDAAAAGVDVPLKQSTLEQQNEVAYKTLSNWKQQHPDWNVGNFASAWNAGLGEPNAYQGTFSTGKPSTGTNAEGVKYDVPGYASSVAKYYQQYKAQGAGGSVNSLLQPQGAGASGGGAVGGLLQPQDDSSQLDSQIQALTQKGAQAPQQGGIVQDLQGDLNGNAAPIGQQLGDAASGIGNFLFPIVGDVANDVTGKNNKTALQQAGDLGLSALPFIPGLGEAGEAARGTEAAVEGAGAVAKGSGLLGTVAKNAAVGYGAGTASNLSQGQSIGQAITPNAANLGGAALGGGSAAILSKLFGGSADQKVVDKLEGVYEDAFGATKSGIQAGSKINARSGETPASFLANAGIPPETEEVNGRTVFKTGEDSNTYQTIQQRTDALTDLRDKLIDSTTGQKGVAPSSLSELKDKALAQANEQFFGTNRDTAVDHINAEFDALKQQFGGDDLTLKQLNTVKKTFQNNANYDSTRPSLITQTNKLVGSLARTQVENDAEKAGVPGIQGINKMIQQHLDFLNTDGKKGLLSKLNGQVVKGGRIGIHAKEVAGSAIGALASQSMGGGPIGDIASGIAGGMVGNKLSRVMQQFSVGGSRMAARIGQIAQENPELIDQLVQILKERGGEEPSGLIAPRLAPAARKAGKVSGLVTKGTIRAGASL